jgi:hypothetical protein
MDRGAQVWEITKLMKALGHATDSSNNRGALTRPGLMINPRVFPPVALVNSQQLNEIIDSSGLPESFRSYDGHRSVPGASNDEPSPVFGLLNSAYFRDGLTIWDLSFREVRYGYFFVARRSISRV